MGIGWRGVRTIFRWTGIKNLLTGELSPHWKDILSLPIESARQEVKRNLPNDSQKTKMKDPLKAARAGLKRFTLWLYSVQAKVCHKYTKKYLHGCVLLVSKLGLDLWGRIFKMAHRQGVIKGHDRHVMMPKINTVQW